MDTGSTAHYTIMIYTILYALGEAQYSGRKIKSNDIQYVSLKE
jgi:hypothetical protein